MKPEKKVVLPTAEDFLTIGVAADWAEHVVGLGFQTIAEFTESKSTQLHQKLNGLRKKNKLDIPALKLEDVEAWLNN